MPELPEVETIRRGLVSLVEGARITSVETTAARSAVSLSRQIFRLHCRHQYRNASTGAPNICCSVCRDGRVLLSHLGMTGAWRVDTRRSRRADPDPRRRAGRGPRPSRSSASSAAGRARNLIYNDPRRFGYIVAGAERGRGGAPAGARSRASGQRVFAEAICARSAPGAPRRSRRCCSTREPLPGSAISMCAKRCGGPASPRPGRRGTLGGGGDRPARRRHPRRSRRGHRRRRLDAQGLSSMPTGSTGYFQHSFDVYGREGEPCRRPGCTGTVARIVQSGRSSFYCPVCQRK